MPTSAFTLAAAMLVAAGCAPDPADTPAGPPARHVEVERLPEQPFHDDDPSPTDLPASGTLDTNDPAAVAISHIRAGLTTEGLDVIDLGADEPSLADGQATVRVAASHRIGPAGEPYTSVYELGLARQSDGSWTVIRSRAVG